MPLETFHPAVAAWFRGAFPGPTAAQAQAWPAIAAGRHTLIAAPTGSGKTLAAFLAAIDDLVRRGVADALPDETAVVYVSPLKALSNDVHINLDLPLAGIRAELQRLGLPDVEIRSTVRTGDTPQAERDRMRKRPPHIVVTTPESLYILLGSESGRRMLATTRTVIVDEIHALAPNKRGAHLALSLERLDALCERRLVRVGLSATQKPIEEVAKFLVGVRPCAGLDHKGRGAGGEGLHLAIESVDAGAAPSRPPLISASANGAPSPQPSPPTIKPSGERGHEGGEVRDGACTHADDGAGIDAVSSPLAISASTGSRPASLASAVVAASANGVHSLPSATTAQSGEKAYGCTIVDAGHARPRDLAIELPEVPLAGVMSGDAWEQVYARLETLINEHRTTLIFVNTRRMAERAARHLSERIGKEYVTAHHGSLSKEHRFDAEQRLKRGELRALVATASLELGIDIGDVDLVCQIGSPRAIATFLQRVGRSGHAVDGTPKGRLFPQSRDELVESVALLDAVRRGELDSLHVERAPLDVLAQQIVAEVACAEIGEDALFELIRRAYPFAATTREQFTAVVRMLAEGFTTRRGPRGAYLHRDVVNGVLRASRGARLTAITSGGAIPDTADYEVTLEPQATRVGSVNEDFAVESIAGDVFQLGNQSYRILRVERGRVRVEDAQGAPPSIPFWLGEAPGRSDELSFAVSRLRQEISDRLDALRPSPSRGGLGGDGVRDATTSIAIEAAPKRADAWLSNQVSAGSVFSRQPSPTPSPPNPRASCARESGPHIPVRPLAGSRRPTAPLESPARPLEGEGLSALAWLTDEIGVSTNVAHQLVAYLASAKAALGVLPTIRQLVMERFFDESGGTQLVIHSPFGSRINRAWGLALRKRFCRSFNFELQAAATEDAIVLSLSTSHSFPLEDVARYLHSASVRDVLVQALLDAPMFGVRWRWNATCALALPRFQGGSKVAPQLQRMKAEDLLATVFPDQVACLENIVGERQIPDHPLVEQTLYDCLHDAMDIDGLVALLQGLEQGRVTMLARDLTGPSPLAAEVLAARPYSFLDDAPLEERRTQAVASRGYQDPTSASDLGRLDPDAIAAVREEAWPDAGNADELHAALMGVAFITDAEVRATVGWPQWLAALAVDRRVTRLFLPANALEPSLAEASVSPEACTERLDTERISAKTAGPAWFEVARLAAERVNLEGTEEAAGTASPQAPSPLEERVGVRGLGSTQDAPPHAIWVPAERLPQFEAILPHAHHDPAIRAPAEYAAVEWSAEGALVEVLRARLTALGPARASDVAASLGLVPADIDQALLALERDGFVMRGRFSAGALDADSETEWCERHLLARIHRYTVRRLRREIEPVEPRDFMRFLFEWQRVAPGTQVSGPDALAGVLAQLEGFEAAASAWESEILPARVDGYEIGWLDALCQAGRVVWTRLRGPRPLATERSRGPVRATPTVLLQRRDLDHWIAFGGLAPEATLALSSRAQAVADFLGAHGASFFDELLSGTRLLQTELEDALGELVAAGLVNADSFSGLRALLVPSSKRPSSSRRHGRRRALFGIEDAGRWSLVRRRAALEDSARKLPVKSDPDALEHVARVLLKRYGVVCWRMLAHEAAWLPPWRELLRVYHRLEARGEIRGGRFVAGISGEQFALPEAIAALRTVRKRAPDLAWVCVCGVDPLNLVGSVLAGEHVPRVIGSRVLYRDGLPVATRVAGDTVLFESMSAADEYAVRMKLLRGVERTHKSARDSSEEE